MRRLNISLCIAALAVAAAAGVGPARGVEPAKAFLDGLRERGYYDIALEYLDTLPDNPAVPVEFKQTLLLERGITLVGGARAQRDVALKEKWLDEGHKVLTEFVETQKTSPFAINARSQLGNVIVEHARLKLEKSRKAAADAKNALLEEARRLYGDAAKIFESQVQEIGERLKQFPASLTEKDGRPFEERENLRKEYLQAQILAAAAVEEMADTHPKGSPEQVKLLTQCAEAYKGIYERYRLRLAGYYARLYQGRSLAKLGKHKEAIGYFIELLDQPDTPDAFHDMRVKATELAIDSWMAEKKYNEIWTKAFPIVDKARANEDRTDSFMEMRVKIARALKVYADELKAEKPKDPLIKQLQTSGRALVVYVSRSSGPFQEEARKMIAEFAGVDPGSVATKKPDPKTFAEARDAGREAVQKLDTNDRLAKDLAARLPTIKEAKDRAEIQQQIEQAKQIAEESRIDAYRYLQSAVQMATSETDSEELNLVRYLLCFLSYSEGKYYDAVVLGEFIARHYPEHQGARQCAKIAMAGWLKIYTENNTDNEFESKRIVEIADYITKQWAGQPEADEALNTLITFMIREKKVKEAKDYLDKIPADSPHRGNAELKTGQAMWAAYLEGSREVREWELDSQLAPEGLDLAARKQELEELKADAESTLTAGVERMKATGELTNILASAAFALADVYVNTNKPDKAIALLEDPKIGALTLVKEKHPSTQKEGFDVETYKIALRAYISALATTKEPQALIDKAKEMMTALKTAMGEGGQNKLVAIYVALARDLQTQMELADDATKKGLAQGFEIFLTEVSKEATELNVLNWVAETYRAMGESFLSSKGGTAAATPYLQKALDAYAKILDRASKDSSSGLATQIRLQMARTNRSMNKFTDAVTQFEEILRPASGRFLLPVQIEAAKTYQDWGAFGGRHADRYGDAIFGARPDKTNPVKEKQADRIIWGWGQIAKMTTGNPKYAEQFHEARYNLALCRYRWALTQKEAAKKTERLKQARADIATTVALYKDLGGPKWEGQYDRLFKDIQKALGEPQTGIASLKQTATPIPTSGKGSGAPTSKTGAPAKTTPAVKPKVIKTSTK